MLLPISSNSVAREGNLPMELENVDLPTNGAKKTAYYSFLPEGNFKSKFYSTKSISSVECNDIGTIIVASW